MCEICGKVGKCDTRCPNYVPPKSNYRCEHCGDPIVEDEEYVSNNNGAYIHYDCLFALSTRSMLDWLGNPVQIMIGEDND